MKLRVHALAAAGLGPLLGGCLAFQQPVVLDVTCPTGAALHAHSYSGACELDGGVKHGPAYVLAPDTQRLLVYATYDHDTLDGRYVRYRGDGTKVEEGTYFGGTKNGVWTSYGADGSRTEQVYVHDEAQGPSRRFDVEGTLRADTSVPVPPPKIEAPPPIPSAPASHVDDMAEEAAAQAEATARVVSPARTRIFPLDGDVAFEASVLLGQDASTIRNSSSFVGGTLSLGGAFGTLRYKTDHYSGVYTAVGVSGVYGEVSRAECEVHAGLCGTRLLAGPYVRVGYARSHHAREEGAIASFKAYMGLSALLGQDQWRVVGVDADAFAWRARVSAGYTGLSIFRHFIDATRERGSREGSMVMLLPLLILVEHGELFFDMGMDRAGGVVGGFGIHLGFGL